MGALRARLRRLEQWSQRLHWQAALLDRLQPRPGAFWPKALQRHTRTGERPLLITAALLAHVTPADL